MNKRTYKFRKPASEFLCALCGVEREIKLTRRIPLKTYLRAFFGALCLFILLFPLVSFKAIVVFPLVWIGFELVYSSILRKEMPCPHCGFDPVWYCKDVRVAKSKVEEFWAEKNKDLVLSVEETLENQ